MMQNSTLLERCKVNTNLENDTFVGIDAAGGNISVNFPLGFRLSGDEKNLRKDILLMLNVLAKNTDRKESGMNTVQAYNCVDLPVQAYLYIISDYYSRGYYREREITYSVSKYGRINWSRTVKTQRAYIQDNDIFFLDYVTRKNNINENELITLIHESCVYESFMKIGWLFSSFVPEKPRISIAKKKKYYSAAVKKKLSETFNDRDRQLFRNMLAVISSLGDDGSANEFRYGTYRFEYVWESMIDKAFGISDKEQYFPKTGWVLGTGKREYENSRLEPDTIMIVNETVYVVDAKYYKYGRTGKASDLPGTTSINKQITYGEYIAETEKFRDAEGKNPKVYNAFLMPYDSFGDMFHTENRFHYIGSAYSEWKASDGTKPYEEIAGILMDVRSLMENYSDSRDRIFELAELIEKSVNKNDRQNNT